MSNSANMKVKAATAAEICTRFDLDKEARPFLQNETGTREFAEALAANKQCIAGIDFIAHALPAREAVWWGCLCLQHTCSSGLCSQEKAACKAAVEWVLQPDESNCAAAQALAEALGPNSLAVGLAAAASKTPEGNLVAGSAPPNLPGPFAIAKAVARVVKIASTKVEPIKIVGTQQLFIELGIAVAEGRFVWPEIRSGARFRMSRRED
jgi:hypothetical protein